MIRTRMAPSPTGEFHIGGMRTLLFNYALAKKAGGQFVMRLEDTDKKREIPGVTQRILDVIKAYGFTWDEYYIQSERLDIYKDYAKTLLKGKHAYYCFCTAERLEEMRNAQKAEGAPVTKYDRHCLTLSEEEIAKKLSEGSSHVVRLKVPESVTVTWNDLVLGEISINSDEIDDQVLLKSDGYPTYHLAVVVDDYLMKISHVLRGVEWLPSTPKQILLYKAFGWEAPIYGHLPNLKAVGATKKLSKRFGDVSAEGFLREGYLPKALLNFLMFLGWNPGTEKEIYSLDEFVNDFDFGRIHKTDLVAFDTDKLLWYNGCYIRNLPDPALLEEIKIWSKKYAGGFNSYGFDDTYLLNVLALIKERLKLLSEYVELSHYFFKDPDTEVPLVEKYAKGETKDIINDFVTLYSTISEDDWNVATLDKVSHGLVVEKGYGNKEAFMTVRLATTGQEATPPLFETLALLGKPTVLRRLEESLAKI